MTGANASAPLVTSKTKRFPKLEKFWNLCLLPVASLCTAAAAVASIREYLRNKARNVTAFQEVQQNVQNVRTKEISTRKWLGLKGRSSTTKLIIREAVSLVAQKGQNRAKVDKIVVCDWFA